MRIAMLTTDGRDLVKRYHEKLPAFGTAPEALLQGLAQIPEIEAHVISCVRQPVISPKKLYPNIHFHTVVVPKIGWMSTAYQGCIRATRKKIREIRPDVVHGQGTERDCAISAVFSGVTNILTIHGNMRLIAEINKVPRFSYPWLAAKLEGFTIPRSDGVVCITSYTREAIEKDARRTWVVPNAVDASFFDVIRTPEDPPVILCVGQISFRKNQNDFIRSLDSLAAAKKFKILFLGMADKNDPCGMEFFQLLQTRPWCIYGGFADREKLKGYLASATILALPSLEDNCPMAVLEAMSAGVPVLAANVGGVPDLIEHGRTGLFCDPLNAASMRDGIENLLDNLQRRDEIARDAKTEAYRRFHPKTIAEKHLEIYREVLKTVS